MFLTFKENLLSALFEKIMEITGDWHGTAINNSKKQKDKFVFIHPKLQWKKHSFHSKMFTGNEFDENIDKRY